ncbi:MAG: hypothetical protein J5X23_11585 [Candidatus Accumulibacter sp.]|nr:hypothetical protein [Accumulibacter sp.]MBO3715596.1 hypothetical protein [Accumulibacter sp.]
MGTRLSLAARSPPGGGKPSESHDGRHGPRGPTAYCCTFVQLHAKLSPVAVSCDQFIPAEESLTMNRIQKWFEQIAVVCLEERHRWALAQEIFGKRRVDVSMLEKPACWRRRSRTYGAPR